MTRPSLVLPRTITGRPTRWGRSTSSKITRITRLVFHYGLAIANDAERPRWDPAGLDEVRRLTAPGR
jgi:hypothetical protein